MDIHDTIRKIWKDPVGSTVIATAITGGVGALLKLCLKIPWYWIIILPLFICVFFVYKHIIVEKEENNEKESNEVKRKEEVILYKNDMELSEDHVSLSNKEEIKKAYDWLDSDVLFTQCIAQTFPGNRNIVWYESSDAVRRLKLFFENLRKKEPYGDAVWWRRGTQAFSVKHAEILDIDTILLDNDRFKISKMAVFVSPNYYKHFIYIEADAEPPTGLYPEINERYIHTKQYECDYLTEEYGEFDGRLITRQEYDDGASVYNGNVVQHNGKAVLRIRYLTKVNCILTAKNSPYNNWRFEQESADLFNDALYSEENVATLFRFLNTFQKQDMPGNR